MKLSRVTPLALLAASCRAAYVQFQDCSDAVTSSSLIPESFRAAVKERSDGFDWKFEVIAGMSGRNACEIDVTHITPRFTVIDYGRDEHEYSGQIVNTSCYTSQWFGSKAQFTVVSSFNRSALLDTFRTTLEMTSPNNKTLSSCIRAVLTPAVPQPIRLLSLWLPITTFSLACLTACWPAQQTSASLASKKDRVARAIDLLAYIQFIFFSGALSLRYPGFFQPLVGLCSWSTLMLPAGIVEASSPYADAGVKDGIYEHNGTITGAPGLELLTQMTGSPVKPQSWLNTFVLSAIVFIFLYLFTYLSRNLNSAGGQRISQLSNFVSQLKEQYWAVVRLFLSCFMLPLSAWATYQFLDGHLLGYRNSAMAIMIMILLLAGLWWSWSQDAELGSLIIQGPGRFGSHQGTVERYYALILFSLMILRGSVIGGLQTYPLAQISILLGCELVHMILNAYWAGFSCFISLAGVLSVSRLGLFCLNIGFIPEVASHSGRMLVAYIILCGHMTVLISIFLIPAGFDMANFALGSLGKTIAEENAPPPEYPMSSVAKPADGVKHLSSLPPDFNQLLVDMILKREASLLLQGSSDVISPQAYSEFLRKVQGEAEIPHIYNTQASFNDSDSTLVNSTRSDPDIEPIKSLSLETLVTHLLSDKNSAIRSELTEHDLNHPINEYFISSSHNTYLLGRQVATRSKLAGYITTLSQGCRCVEVDCWDGRDGQPVVKHGYSLTKSISFRSVIQTIKDYAFIASDLPLWLSLEVHCKPVQRDIMARTMLEIFGSSLVVEPLEISSKTLPSPNQLRGKILLKVKVAQAVIDEDPTVSNSDLTTNQSGDLLQSLAIYGASRRLPQGVFDVHRNFIYSVSERNFKKHINNKRPLGISESQHIVRVYPDPNRVDSSNFDPLPCWMHGVQMVALNCQTDDPYTSLNRALFYGSSGYVHRLQPKPTQIRLHVDVLMAREVGELPMNSPMYVEIGLLAPDRTCQKKMRTAAMFGRGSDIAFGENLDISVRTEYPDLTFLHWSLKLCTTKSDIAIFSGIEWRTIWVSFL
ncbi:1-phosphatidylinositol-4,5-bisphosphate phosphodiesterase 1 [Fusarium austroafricanum]|uniref:Phosphoinositide phospholipase C n=1 Tax=Fusarium austroafricanum TaxID=2364996 RepID=A0A8H4K3R1_9HYPO|nr:1-phosphatidylinositol-4,5-bisphosphate phosphodiesterase 1 [Fusarium austroafricanum]